MSHYKAILFDLNGTLINIWTDETREEIYRTISNLFYTYGIELSPEKFRDLFYKLMDHQRKSRKVEHPEFDVVGIFRTILKEYATPYTRSLPEETLAGLPEFLSHTYRSASMLRLETYPCVHHILDQLQKNYILAVVSDAQPIWEEAELRRLDLDKYFPIRVISGSFGFRKPEEALFRIALDKLKLAPEDVIYVGNDMHRDVCGSKRIGMQSIYFQSNQGDQRYHGYDPDYIIYKFEELPAAVQFLENKGTI